jgi:hypothetical protein
MNYSSVWNDFQNIMLKKSIVKTASKGDDSYNVVSEKAGPDMKVDETGYELTELAHPEQICVSLSQLNDGIIENGVIANDVMKLLVKIANELDGKDMKIVAEIDAFLTKKAQQFRMEPASEASYSAFKEKLVEHANFFQKAHIIIAGMIARSTSDIESWQSFNFTTVELNELKKFGDELKSFYHKLEDAGDKNVFDHELQQLAKYVEETKSMIYNIFTRNYAEQTGLSKNFRTIGKKQITDL